MDRAATAAFDSAARIIKSRGMLVCILACKVPTPKNFKGDFDHLIRGRFDANAADPTSRVAFCFAQVPSHPDEAVVWTRVWLRGRRMVTCVQRGTYLVVRVRMQSISASGLACYSPNGS